MVYRAIGLMSGSSLDGIDIAFVSFEEIRGQWRFELRAQKCIEYTEQWQNRLRNAAQLTARDFVQLDYDLGQYMGQEVKAFIEENHLDHQVQLIVSHGHTIFHAPKDGISTQIGSAAAIAAITSINVIDQLRQLDIALGGQGAPLVPIGEKLLFPDYQSFLNLGGIANISFHYGDQVVGYDVTVANQALNYLANLQGQPFDKEGQLASRGQINTTLLSQLNKLNYFSIQDSKSLSNQFFTETLLPLLSNSPISLEDKLCTYTEHIANQIAYAAGAQLSGANPPVGKKVLITGGGAKNLFLIGRISKALTPYGFQAEVAVPLIIDYKEAIIMAFLGVLRWREENTVLSNTGASRPSIGGSVWIGQPY